ncbi:CDP-alcohol phosphatidyltransferase family protein [Candidatus Palauibacter sp.]|uniref:CDP-alcohol phosphatidyltransferase family protein n=1 Tax=Candidatus Palauibacter sp. TaxID=3101350 RepID=UPI003B01B17D
MARALETRPPNVHLPGHPEGLETRRKRRIPIKTHDPGFLTLSNLLSLSRIPLGFAFTVVTDPGLMAVLVATAGATDVLDGFIARVSGTRSQIGLLLDPLCDKLFVLLALAGFLASGGLDGASFLILILRDLYTAGSYFLARLVSLIIPFTPRWPGKIATGLQFLTLLALIFDPRYVPALVLLVGVTSVWAIIDYGTHCLRRKWKSVA